MKKTVLILLALLVTVGCSNGNTASNGSSNGSQGSNTNTALVSDPTQISGKVRLIVAGGQLENGIDPLTGRKMIGLKEYFKSVFKEKYPNIKVDVSAAPWESVDSKMRSQLMSKSIDVLSSGGYEAQYHAEGLVRDIDDLLAADTDFHPEDLYISGLWENSVFNKSLDGRRFALPSALGQRMVVYDKKLFDDWGVDYLSDNPTVEEVIEKAKQMTGINPKTGEQNYGLYFNGNNQAGSLFTTLTYAFDASGFEGSLEDKKAIQWKLADPNMVKLFEWLAEASKLTHPAFVNNQGNENFGTERNVNAILLEQNGSKVISDYIMSGNKEMINRFVPVLNLGPNGEGWVANDGITMAKEPQDLNAAWEVMKYVAGYDFQKYLYENFGSSPTLKTADFVDPANVYMQKALEIAEYGHFNIHDSVNEFFNAELNPAVNGFISSAASGKAPDIDSFLQQLQEKANNWSSLLK